ncbi:MAG: T9SS type A sorting domain-containing protein [Bacteroidetes bacterium]|nr:T9SS type A sorting domain-containing protein [Bacteroidota bacterium]
MKSVLGQSGIKIIGPSLSYYDFVKYDSLLKTSSPYNIVGSGSNGFYIDYVAFNTYPFSKTALQASTARQSIIDYVMTPYQFSTILDTINKRIMNAGRSATLKPMVTEVNISPKQDSISATTRGPSGVGPGSFLGGQFWAEMMAKGMEKGVETMAFWSVKEGQASNNYVTDIGYIGQEFSNKRSTYWHYDMVANNFKGTYWAPLTITGGSSKVKAFASRSSDRIAVMILNQNSTGSLPFKVRLTSGGTAGSSLDIQFNITGATSGANHVSTANIQNQSTVLLIFDCKGAISERYDYSINNFIANQAPVKTTPSGSTPLIGGQISNNIGSSTLCSSGGNCATFTYSSPLSLNYSWTCNTGGAVTASGNTVEMCSLNPGGQTIYTFIATDPASTCSTTQDVIVNDCGVIVGFGFYAYICGITPSNCGTNTGAATACAGGGGSSAYSWSWDGGPYGTNITLSGLSPGIHTVKVKDAPAPWPGPTITLNFNVPVINAPVISAGPDKTAGRFCKVTLTAVPNLTSSGYTYKWYKGNSTTPFSNSYVTTFSSWNTDNYKVVVTSPSGCTNSDVVKVTVNPTPRCFTKFIDIATPISCDLTDGGGSPNPVMDVLSASRTINSDQYIDKIIIVPNNMTLTIDNSELSLSINSKIIVQPGGKLEIRDSYLHGCQNNKWGGIQVKGNNNVSNQFTAIGSAFVNSDYTVKTDKTLNIYLEDNIFANGVTALELEKNKDFSIRKNYFFNYAIGIKTSKTPLADVKSIIKENTFEAVKTAIYFEDDNHARLDIKCNKFDHYSEYAIYSERTTLKDQGSNLEGAANEFISASTKLNDKLHHDGNSMKYYYDPSNPVSLITSGGLNAIAQSASADGTCAEQLARYNNSGSEEENEISYTILNDKMALTSVPNPNSGEAAIYFNLGGEAQGELIIFDICGKTIDRLKVNSEVNKIDVKYNQLSDGIYLMSLTNSKGEVINKKMIITR